MSVEDARLGSSPAAVPAIDAATLVGLGIMAALALAPLALGAMGADYLVALLVRAMLLAIAAISLDLLIGRGGLVSFGHAAFVAIGAYVAGIGLTEELANGLTLLLLSVAICAGFAAVTGAIALRTKGVAFIMITLAFGQMAYFSFTSLSQYGGDDGLTLWSTAELWGTGWLENGGGLYFVILAALAGTWWLVARLTASRFGRVLRAARENPTRVETMGYDVFRYRLAAYVIAGALAGVAGFLTANHLEFVSPALGSWHRSGELIAIVVLGGVGTRNGALLGALFFVVVEEALSHVVEDWRLIFGPLLVLLVLFARGGLAGALGRLAPRR